MKKFILICLLVGITTVLVQGGNGQVVGYVYVNDQLWDATLIMNEANNTAVLYRSDRFVQRGTAIQALQGQQVVMEDMSQHKKWNAILGWIIDVSTGLELPYNPFKK